MWSWFPEWARRSPGALEAADIVQSGVVGAAWRCCPGPRLPGGRRVFSVAGVPYEDYAGTLGSAKSGPLGVANLERHAENPHPERKLKAKSSPIGA